MEVNYITLIEKMALHDMYCAICHEEIDIGDSYYSDFLSVHEGKDKVYCQKCVLEERQI